MLVTKKQLRKWKTRKFHVNVEYFLLGRSVARLKKRPRILSSLTCQPIDELDKNETADQRIIREAKLSELEEERNRKKNWEKQKADFDPRRYIDQWSNVAKQMSKQFLPIAIKALATIDGAIKANDSIKMGLSMGEAQIDLGVLSKAITKVATVEFIHKIIARADIPNFNKEHLLDRFIAAEIPNREGGAPSGSATPRYIKDLQDQMRFLVDYQQRVDNENRGKRTIKYPRHIQNKRIVQKTLQKRQEQD